MALMIKPAVAAPASHSAWRRAFAPCSRGEVVPVLEAYCPYCAGFYLYYPSRRNLAPTLLALVDHPQACR